MYVTKEVPDYVYDCDGNHLDQLLVIIRKKEIELHAHVDGAGNTFTIPIKEIKKWCSQSSPKK